MRNFLFLFFLISVPVFGGQKFLHKDPIINQEFENVYKDIGSKVSVLTTNTSGQYLVGQGTGIAPIWATAAAPALKVIQWTYGQRTSAFNNTTTTFQSVGSSCTITPTSASNYVLVIAHGALGQSNASQYAFASIGRNAVNIGGTNGLSYSYGSLSAPVAPATLVLLDAPNSTSPLIYSPMLRTSGVGTGEFCGTNTICQTFCFELAP